MKRYILTSLLFLLSAPFSVFPAVENLFIDFEQKEVGQEEEILFKESFPGGHNGSNFQELQQRINSALNTVQMSDPLCITKTLYENFEPCCIRVYLKTAGTSKLVGLAFVKQEEKEDYWQEEKEDYWQEDPRNLYIKYICIKKNAHKKGIGSMLIEQIAQFFKARSIGLCVDDKETEKFYKKNNFIENNFTDSNNGNAEFYKKYPEYENEKDAPEDRKRKYCKRRAEELTQENPVTKKRRFETLSEEFVSSVFNFATPDSSFQPE